MDDILARVWNDFVARSTGPMWFRLILQPLVAAFFGVRAGLRNAKGAKSEGAPDPDHRKTMFGQARKDVGKMLVIGFVLDAVFQLIALRTFYLGEALLVAILLVAVPYTIIRSVAGRLGSRG